MSTRVCVLTAGHLSTSPRMLKAADALAAAGYRVRVVSTRHVDWATAADCDVRWRRGNAWRWTQLDYSRASARAIQVRTGIRYRAARALARMVGPRRVPMPLAVAGYARVHRELVRAALAEPADFFYGGTTGALAAVAEAGRRAGMPFALDLEDFHTAEQGPSSDAGVTHALASRIERKALPDATFVTASNEAISAAYEAEYGVHPIPIHNTFPLPEAMPEFEPGPHGCLRLYWFSQTIGANRGLEDAVRAMGLAQIRGELHLRGRGSPGYVDSLQRLAHQVARRLKLVAHEPGAPDSMIRLCQGYDVGLAIEPGHNLNNALSLSNKALTYVLAGLAVVLTDTPGQAALVTDLADGAVVYTPGDVQTLAAGLRRWANDKAALRKAKAAAWAAAQRRWHWEHPEERGALVHAVEKALR